MEKKTCHFRVEEIMDGTSDRTSTDIVSVAVSLLLHTITAGVIPRGIHQRSRLMNNRSSVRLAYVLLQPYLVKNLRSARCSPAANVTPPHA